MTDPLGLIGNNAALTARNLRTTGPAGAADAQGPSFGAMLEKQLAEVNRMQSEATRAIEEYGTGERKDIETVIQATEQADTAFQLLMQVRNRMLDAYEEVKQMRV